VTLKQELPPSEWKGWAAAEIGRLRGQLDTPTPELEAAQRQWEKSARWTVIRTVASLRTKMPEPFPWLFEFSPYEVGPQRSIQFQTNLVGITGFRLEEFSEGEVDDRARDGEFPSEDAIKIVAALPGGRQFSGRYVRVQILDRSEFLHIAEVEVYGGSKNLALAGRATQSSTSLEAVAGRAIDGDTNGSWGGNSVSHTSNQLSPWWEVDLGSSHPVNRIVIFNRTDGDLESRLRGFRVSLLDEGRETVWQRSIARPPDPKLELHLSPVPVEFVRSAEVSGRASDGVSQGTAGRRVLVLPVADEIGFPGGTDLSVEIARDGQRPGKAARRFRLSATRMPGQIHDIPPEIARILATPAADRADRQTTKLAAFFRQIAAELQPIRARCEELDFELEAASGDR
jgi:hypothetical protein